MKNRFLTLVLVLGASVMMSTVYAQSEAFIATIVTDFVVYQAQCEKDMRTSPSAQSRVVCKPSEYNNYVFARIIARYGIETVVKMLAQKGSEDIAFEQIVDSVISCKDLKLAVADFYSPLIHLAARYNNVPMLELILTEGDYINLGTHFPTTYYTDTAGCYCFISDISCKSFGIVPSKQILVFPHNHSGYTPLHVAVFTQAKEAVSFLLQQHGVKVDAGIFIFALKSFPYAGSLENMQKAGEIFEMLLKCTVNLNINHEISKALIWLKDHKSSILKKYINARYAVEAIEQSLNQKACCIIA